MDDAREHLLAGAGLAGQEHRYRCAGDAAGDAQQIRRGFRNPEALRFAIELFCRPERRALFLVAAELFQRAGGRHDLGDRREGAAMLEVGLGLREQEPGLVAMMSDRQQVLGWCLLDGCQRVRLCPSVSGDDPRARRPSRHQCHARRAVGVLNERERLGSQDVRVSRQFEQCHRRVEVRGGVRGRGSAEGWLTGECCP